MQRIEHAVIEPKDHREVHRLACAVAADVAVRPVHDAVEAHAPQAQTLVSALPLG